jgi:hypothetical protein
LTSNTVVFAGNDDPNSQYNTFTTACLDYMGRFSQLAKEQDDYIVSMAPAGTCALSFLMSPSACNVRSSDAVSLQHYVSTESYLDPTMPTFDRSLLHNYAEWEPIVPNFRYHGMNAYAYILERYGKCTAAAEQGSEGGAGSGALRNTFDFVTIQLYEGYSHAEYNTTQLHVPPAEYVTRFVQSVLRGWDIDYSTDTELQFPYVRHMRLDCTQLVVGLSNGWAGDGKFFLLYPDEVRTRHFPMLPSPVDMKFHCLAILFTQL